MNDCRMLMVLLVISFQNIPIKTWPDTLSGPTISRSGSSVSAFDATEVYMGLDVEGRSEKKSSTNTAAQINTKTGMQLKEALQLQLDVQRRLHEQLEIQRNLQLRIEEQAKQLKMMFEQQQRTKRNLMESINSDSKCPNNSSPTLEDSEVLVSEESNDDTVFP